jgi:putative ABC transport system permease protein
MRVEALRVHPGLTDLSILQNMRGVFGALRGFWFAIPLAVRSLRRNPGFFLIAGSSLAVALGLATTVFAHIDALTHPFVPVRDVGSLYRFAIIGSGSVNQPSGDDIAQMIAMVPSLEGVAMGTDSHGTVSAGDKGANVDGYAVPPDYFKVLGLRPRLGRLFTPEETEESGVAMVSDAIWKLLFSNRDAIGKAIISYDGRDYAVVGVVPLGLDKVQSSDVWLPRPHHYPRSMMFLGRAKKGVTESRIRADLQVVIARLSAVYGTGRPPFSVYLHAATPDPFQLNAYHGAMLGAAICILIIACGNVSALMLARGVVLRRDHAVRLSLGATRLDLLTTVAAEVFVIALGGGIAGMFLATWLMQIAASLLQSDPSALGIVFEAQWSGRVSASVKVVVA